MYFAGNEAENLDTVSLNINW